MDRIDIVEKDLPRLSEEQLNDIIRSNANKYRASHKKEMDDMTKIIDYNDTIKNDTMAEEWKELLTEKWQL